MLRLSVFSLLLLTMGNSLAETGEYLCKVNGSFYDPESSSNIKETISLSFEFTSHFYTVKIIGSEHSEVTMSLGAPGKSLNHEGVDTSLSWENRSVGTVVDLIESMRYNKVDMQAQQHLIFNKKTKMLSFTRDNYKGTNSIARVNYSGLCFKP